MKTDFIQQLMTVERLPSVSVAKSLLPMQELQEMWIRSLGWEDPPGEEMETRPSILSFSFFWLTELCLFLLN